MVITHLRMKENMLTVIGIEAILIHSLLLIVNQHLLLAYFAGPLLICDVVNIHGMHANGAKRYQTLLSLTSHWTER